MSKKCTLCGSTDVVPCGNNLVGEPMLICNNCKEPGVWYKFEEPTVFDRITQSPEVLAEEFVEIMYNHVLCDSQFFSMLTYQWYTTKEAAIAATVARLKEVAE